MSKLIDDLEVALNPPKPCKMCDILLELDAEDAQSIVQALKSGAPVNTISRVLTKNGYPIGAGGVGGHVKKGHS